MGLESLARVEAKRVVGLDCSTKSLAFAVFEDGEPVTCGEVWFEGEDVLDRLDDAGDKTKALVDSGVLKADYIVMEAAIYANNMQVAIKLAYVFGAVLRELMTQNPVVVQKAPISWQTAIGNPNLTKEEKEAIKRDNPNKSQNWYQGEGRRIRKERTMDIARGYFDIAAGSDNVSDAVGIALAAIRTDIR